MPDDAVWTCPNCGEEPEEQVDYHGELLCVVCYDAKLEYCACCGNKYDPHSEDSWGDMCPSCAEEHFVCDSCRGTFYNDDYGGDGDCTNCYNDNNDNNDDIPEYHSGGNGLNFLPDEEQALYFGVELETDKYEDRYKAGQELHKLSNNKTLFWYEDDSSLSRGIEIISQPCTLNYHTTEFPWERISEIVTRHGGKSHNTETCGMHIHFSRRFFNGVRNAKDIYTLRLIYLFEKFYEEICLFSRRSNNGNARKYNRDLFNCPAHAKIGELQEDFYRYQAVNIRNHDTIEIRTFKGTLKVDTILASIELVDFLVRYCKKTSTKKLQALTWAELVKEISKCKYRYLMPYIIMCGLVKEDK